MTKPRTWEDGAHQAAERIWAKLGPPFSMNEAEALSEIRDEIDGMVAFHVGRDDGAACPPEDLTRIGAYALFAVAQHDTNPSLRDALFEIQALAARKHHDYGVGNITMFGLQGILVRMSDKVERLRNMARRGESPSVAESVLDAWRDLVGYSIVGIMFLNNSFLLPLAQDVVPSFTPEQIEARFLADIEPKSTLYVAENGNAWIQVDRAFHAATAAEGVYDLSTPIGKVFHV